MLGIHRLFIRTSLCFLFAGVAMGGAMLLGKALGTWRWPFVFVTLHTHLILVGFMAMMVMGVAHWMFPRRPGERRAELNRDPIAWANYLLLTVGLLLRVATEPWLPATWARHGLAASALMQLAGFACFLLAIWGRVRGPGPLKPSG